MESVSSALKRMTPELVVSKQKVVQRSRFSFFREAQIWYSRDPEQYPVSDQFENVIVLSDEFYREIIAHPIPADLEAVKVLGGAPAVLDLFMWLSYRCFLAKGVDSELLNSVLDGFLAVWNGDGPFILARA